MRLGIDVACRAAHQASLADTTGRYLWSGRRFRTTVEDLERLRAMLPEGTEPSSVTVVMEPTRNAWVPLAAWFRRRGAVVVLVPPEQSADLPDLLRQAHQVRPAGLPGSWPASRCCTRRACTPRPDSAPATRCAGRSNCAPTWSNAARAFLPGSTPCWNCSGRAGTPRWAPTWPTRPRCGFWRTTPTRTRSSAWAGHAWVGSWPATPAAAGARTRRTR
ncbi:transposase [Saccharothrix sp. S26]|uniref:IS110 family transposase n=1 Tax=Saccharothrix sp. S26 TaxID=2907215 RepID=UPI0035AB7C91